MVLHGKVGMALGVLHEAGGVVVGTMLGVIERMDELVHHRFPHQRLVFQPFVWDNTHIPATCIAETHDTIILNIVNISADVFMGIGNLKFLILFPCLKKPM